MRARCPVVLCVLAIALVAAGATAQSSNSQLVERYVDTQAVAEATQALQRPVSFERDRSTLSDLSTYTLEDQALTLAANPALRVTVWVGTGADGDERLALARFRALTREFEALGVDRRQLWLVADPDAAHVAPDEAAIGSLYEGALEYGVALVPLDIRAWPGAEVFVLAFRHVQHHPDAVCAPPSDAETLLADNQGGARLWHSKRKVLVVGRDDERLSTLSHHVGLDAQPIDLAAQVHDARCDDAP
ncbi:hypothetical protein [Rubrivirga sp. IMCC45206]|uniref:hypothetical protein n=1 Tax=Rubrivirga sp. IMCC45206 TaxID=3391614 RepID=UPI003990107B